MVKSHQKIFNFDLNVNWFDMFGKYFLVKNSHEKLIEYYYPVISLTPTYLTLKKMWLESVDSSLPDCFSDKSYQRILRNAQINEEEKIFGAVDMTEREKRLQEINKKILNLAEKKKEKKIIQKEGYLMP